MVKNVKFIPHKGQESAKWLTKCIYKLYNETNHFSLFKPSARTLAWGSMCMNSVSPLYHLKVKWTCEFVSVFSKAYVAVSLIKRVEEQYRWDYIDLVCELILTLYKFSDSAICSWLCIFRAEIFIYQYCLNIIHL